MIHISLAGVNKSHANERRDVPFSATATRRTLTEDEQRGKGEPAHQQHNVIHPGQQIRVNRHGGQDLPAVRAGVAAGGLIIARIAMTLFQLRAVPLTCRCFSKNALVSSVLPKPFGQERYMESPVT